METRAYMSMNSALIYQITLPSGMVVTGPRELNEIRKAESAAAERPVVASDGRVLVPPRRRASTETS